MKKQLDPARFYPVGEAAQWLDVSSDTIKQYIRSGRLKGKTIEGNPPKTIVLAESILTLRSEREAKLNNKRRPVKSPSPKSGLPDGCGKLITVAEAAKRLH